MHRYLLSISGMRCGACSAKVHGALSSLESIKAVEVDHQRDLAVVSAAVALDEIKVRLALSQVGGFALDEMKAEEDSSAPIGDASLTIGESDSIPEEPSPQSLFPLFLIVVYIFTVTLLISWSNSEWSMDSMMRHFMSES